MLADQTFSRSFQLLNPIRRVQPREGARIRTVASGAGLPESFLHAIITDAYSVGGGRVLVGPTVFKTVCRALIPFWVGSIPMHLRHTVRSAKELIG